MSLSFMCKKQPNERVSGVNSYINSPNITIPRNYLYRMDKTHMWASSIAQTRVCVLQEG
jgi:hypothetical protein